jgi:hypothetical protein
MREIDKPTDFDKNVDYLLREAGVIFAEGQAEFEEHVTPVDGETVDMLRKYLHDGFLEHFRAILEDDPSDSDAQEVMYEENAYMTVDKKLEDIQLTSTLQAVYHLSLNNREAEALGYAVGIELFNRRGDCDYERQPWDKVQFAQEAEQLVTFFGNFKNAGGLPNEQYTQYFQHVFNDSQ